METVAYLQQIQNYEGSELHGLTFAPLKDMKVASKTIAGVVGVASMAWAGGLLTTAPASANYDYQPCCSSDVYQSTSYTPACSTQSYYPQSYSSYGGCDSYYPNYYNGDNYYTEDNYYNGGNYYDEGNYYNGGNYESVSSSGGCGCSQGGGYSGVAYYPGVLRVGSSGEMVALLQQSLISQGFYVGPVDGVYGHQTANAVAQYQSVAGLMVDGVAGGQTLSSLGIAG